MPHPAMRDGAFYARGVQAVTVLLGNEDEKVVVLIEAEREVAGEKEVEEGFELVCFDLLVGRYLTGGVEDRVFDDNA